MENTRQNDAVESELAEQIRYEPQKPYEVSGKGLNNHVRACLQHAGFVARTVVRNPAYYIFASASLAEVAGRIWDGVLD